MSSYAVFSAFPKVNIQVSLSTNEVFPNENDQLLKILDAKHKLDHFILSFSIS